MSSEVIGSVGVGLILLAFLLNLVGRVSERHPFYLILNIVGSGMACWFAWVGDSIPFVVLEGVWCAAAITRLAANKKGAPAEAEAP